MSGYFDTHRGAVPRKRDAGGLGAAVSLSNGESPRYTSPTCRLPKNGECSPENRDHREFEGVPQIQKLFPLARKGARGMVEGYFGNLLRKGVGTETEGPRCTPTNSELNIPDLDDATLA